MLLTIGVIAVGSASASDARSSVAFAASKYGIYEFET